METKLKAFLSGFPETFHPKDMERFVAYVCACYKQGRTIDVETIRESLKDDDLAERYISYATVIECALDCYVNGDGQQ